MQKILLSGEHIYSLVKENSYTIHENKELLSRCIDGRYEAEEDLPACALPGADPGQMMIVCGAAQSYGFEVIREKLFEVLCDVVGGIQNVQFHTDTHDKSGELIAGCGHISQVRQAPASYGLVQDDIDFMTASIAQARKSGARDYVLQGEHAEGAVVILRGNMGLYPRYELMIDKHPKQVQVFVHQQTLINKRHRVLAQRLIEHKAVKLVEGCDEGYLYEVLSDVCELHFLETAKRLAKGLPIYEVKFDNDGEFKVENLGNV
ncbi:MAG: hypothetical protein WC489_05220 [Patescibacteria group bacterium]